MIFPSFTEIGAACWLRKFIPLQIDSERRLVIGNNVNLTANESPQSDRVQQLPDDKMDSTVTSYDYYAPRVVGSTSTWYCPLFSVLSIISINCGSTFKFRKFPEQPRARMTGEFPPILLTRHGIIKYERDRETGEAVCRVGWNTIQCKLICALKTTIASTITC